MTEDYFEIGTIVNTHGVRGEIRVMPDTDDPERFSLLDKVDVFQKNAETVVSRAYALENARIHKNMAILKFKGIDDRNAAEKLVGGVLKIPPEKALPLDDDEYYMRDLLEMDVFTDDDEYLGKLVQIIQTGANDVYVVRQSADGFYNPPERYGKKTTAEILIPAIRQCILDVDIPQRRMVVHLLDGLRG